jgi:hypothetical protein
MELYDYVVALYEEDLVVLRRVGREVRSETCPYRDIRSVRVGHCLLRGDIHLGLADGRSSGWPQHGRQLMLRLVERAERYRHDLVALGSDLDADVPEGTLASATDCSAGSEVEAGCTCARRARPSGPCMGRLRWLICRGESVFSVTAPLRRPGAHHRQPGPALLSWEAVSAVETSYLPVAGISGAEWLADVRNDAIDLELRTGEGEDRFAFAADNPALEPYGAYLATVAASRP